jgi:DNA-binding XRE family transcriptional regulator
MQAYPFDLLCALKERRRAIPAEAVSIGEHRRDPRRIGRPVTQGELAEVFGVSREWYCALENGNWRDASPELLGRITMALHGRRAARSLECELHPTSVPRLAELAGYIKRVCAASSFVEAAVEAIETGTALLGATSVSVINFQNGEDVPTGVAVGPRARFWSPLCDSVVADAHKPLKYGGIGVSEYVPTVEEVAADPAVLLTFEHPSETQNDYRYECATELWRDFNVDVHVRSVIALPLRDRSGYRGTIGFSWDEPRPIGLGEIELAQTLAGVLELIS